MSILRVTPGTRHSNGLFQTYVWNNLYGGRSCGNHRRYHRALTSVAGFHRIGFRAIHLSIVSTPTIAYRFEGVNKIARITIGCAVVIIQIYVWKMVWAWWVYPGLAGDAKIPAREWIVLEMYFLPFWLATLVVTLVLVSFKVVRHRWKYGLVILIFVASFVASIVPSWFRPPYEVFVQRLAARVQKDVTLQTLREFMASQREGLKSARQLGQDASGRIPNGELPTGIQTLYPDSYFTAVLYPSFDGDVGYVVVDWGSPYLRWGFVVLDNPSAMGPTLGGVRAVHHLDNTVYCYIRY